MTHVLRYSTDQLITWASVAPVCLSHDISLTERVRQLGISRRHRGCRSGKSVRSDGSRHAIASLQPVGNGAYVISGNRPSPRGPHVFHDNRSNLITVPVLRHAGSTPGRTLGFASLNVRSLSPLKLDGVLVEFRDRSLDILVLCETWHDSDSVSIRRLPGDGFSVVERARPRRAPNSLGTNHGGVAVVAAV